MKKLNKIENYIFTFKGEKEEQFKILLHTPFSNINNEHVHARFLLEYTEMFPLIVLVM